LLINMPCNLETHKTFDNITYYKCGDIGQVGP
jgi:TATA-binding protein-associated factor Taf7